jgi:beta-N-acetylhexosaminidase
MNLRHAVGSLLIVGLEGTELSPVETAWLRLIRPSGVILFRRNIEEAAQVYALLQSATAGIDQPAFRCVDLEGGLVDRLRDLIAPVPSVGEVAATSKKKLFLEHGRLIGEEISLLGFNTTFAPVLDLALPVSANVMRTRVAASTPGKVIEYAKQFLSGLEQSGVVGCGKHFPGLGGGTLDSHQATPEIQRSWQQIWEEDLLPYRKLRKQLPLVMISHAAYPRVKETQGPASVSSYWIRDVLQGKIGYRGLVLSDDMEMGGILTQHSIEEASIAAVVAGTHLLEICKQPALILQTYEALLAEAERSKAFRAQVERAARQVHRHKLRLLKKSITPSAPDAAAVQAVRERIVNFFDTVNKLANKLKTNA